MKTLYEQYNTFYQVRNRNIYQTRRRIGKKKKKKKKKKIKNKEIIGYDRSESIQNNGKILKIQ